MSKWILVGLIIISSVFFYFFYENRSGHIDEKNIEKSNEPPSLYPIEKVDVQQVEHIENLDKNESAQDFEDIHTNTFVYKDLDGETYANYSKTLQSGDRKIYSLETNFSELDAVEPNGIFSIDSPDGEFIEFYISEVVIDGHYKSIVGNLDGFEPGYYFGLTYSSDGYIEGEFFTDSKKYEIHTLYGVPVILESIKRIID